MTLQDSCRPLRPFPRRGCHGRRGRIAGAAILVTVLCAAGGCAWTGRVAAVTVELRSLDVAQRRIIDGWTLWWWDGTRVRSRRVGTREESTPEESTPDGTGPLRWRLPIASGGADAVVVALRPSVGGISMLPAGGWVRAPETLIVLRPEHGDAAEVLLDVARHGVSPALVNLTRLATILDHQAGAAADRFRYRLDRDRLRQAIGAGTLNHYDIAMVERSVCAVEERSGAAGDPRPWISDDLRRPVVDGLSAAGRVVWAVPVAPGEVRHLWQPTQRRMLTVARDPAGHVRWFMSRRREATSRRR